MDHNQIHIHKNQHVEDRLKITRPSTKFPSIPVSTPVTQPQIKTPKPEVKVVTEVPSPVSSKKVSLFLPTVIVTLLIVFLSISLIIQKVAHIRAERNILTYSN